MMTHRAPTIIRGVKKEEHTDNARHNHPATRFAGEIAR
jgi:hypothetical protein